MYHNTVTKQNENCGFFSLFTFNLLLNLIAVSHEKKNRGPLVSDLKSL